MRPMENGKTPKKKGKKGRGEKTLNGVKTTLVKAKVSAVKNARKLQAKDAEEVEDLLNQTANGHAASPAVKKAVAEKVTKASSANKQMKKLKSLVQVQSNNQDQDGEVRKSERIRLRKLSQKAGNISGVDEVAMEATEVDGPKAASNGGLLQRTISKIWRIPEGLTGAVPYSDIQEKAAVEVTNGHHATNGTAASGDQSPASGGKNSCVIS